MKNFFNLIAASALLLPSTVLLAKQGGPNKEQYYTTVDSRLSKAELKQADVLRLKTIRSIKSLLKQKSIKGAKRFELTLRLGELYAERHDYLRAQEIEEFDQAYDSWKKKGKKGRSPKISHKKSKSYLAKSANTFRKLVKQFPKHTRTASALFALGKTLSRLDSDSSIVYFQKLIKNHRKSKLIPDTHLAMGDFYFDKHQIDKAITSYREMLRHTEHRAYPYAVYKLGWSYFNKTPKNKKDAKEALGKSITSFKLVIRLADKKKRSGKINLRSEAIKDLIMVWADTEDTKAAWAYFKTIGEKDSFYDLLERLGGIYAAQGRNKKAIEVYARLLKDAPPRKANPAIHEKLVALFELTNNRSSVVTHVKEMNTQYLERSKWSRKFSDDKGLIADATKRVEFTTRRYGSLYHSRSQKTKNKYDRMAAANIYEQYLKSFSKNKEAYNIRFYYADVLLDLKRNEQASTQYTLVANQKGKHQKNAAKNAVIAMNNVDRTKKYAKLPPAGQVPKPIALPPTKKKLLAVLDNYVRLLPKDREGHPMRFTAAQTLFNYGHYDESLKRFEKVVTDIPATKQARASSQIIIGYELERKNWEKASTIAKSHLGNKKLVDRNLRKYLVATLKKSLYQQALDLEKNKRHAEAGKTFVAYQKEFRTDKTTADRALFNASNNFFKAGMLEDAIMANQRLLDYYPKSKQAPQAILNIAQTYEALAEFDKAAGYYKRYAYSYPTYKLAPNTLYNAAILSKGTNKLSQSRTYLERFLAKYPTNALKVEALREVAELQEKLKAYKSAVKAYDRLASATKRSDPNLSLYASAKSAELTDRHVNRRSGRSAIARVRAKLTAKSAPPALDARRIIAEREFNAINAEFSTYKSYKINNSKRIESQIKTKQTKLERLAKAYQRVIQIASPEYSVASLYRLGEAHEDFANSLRAAPAPHGSNQVAENKFRSMIDKLAFPLKDDAYKFYQSAFKQSQDVETFTIWTKLTYNKMADLAPQKHPEVLEQSAEPKYMAHQVRYNKKTEFLAH